jgi:magnesium transporter
MITAYFKEGESIRKLSEKDDIAQIKVENLVWVDLNFPSVDEKVFIEKLLKIDLQSSQYAEEIELSSRYTEYEDLIAINSNFMTLKDGLYNNEPVSFFLKNQLLISYRNADLRSFSDTVKKFKVNTNYFADGILILISLFEARIDLDADLLEELGRQISDISKILRIENNLEVDVLLRISALQENTMIIRENIIDNQRVVSSMLRSDNIPDNQSNKLRILIKDISSLLDHTTFNFERLEYLQNTFMGLVDLEQNKVVKIFTIVTVIFLPPTLISSIYGMNFKYIPELEWTGGYPFAILLMILSSLLTFFVFKRNKWL